MEHQQCARPAPHPRRLHEEAFDLYCAGLSCPKVGAALRGRYGADAPHVSSLKRWMVRDRWASRRQVIRLHATRLDDRLRATDGSGHIASLTGLRDTLVAAVGSELPFRSAEGAVFSLAALQKVIDRLSRAAAEASEGFSQDYLEQVVETVYRVLSEDEEVGPVLDRRYSQILGIIERSLDDQSVYRLARPPDDKKARPSDGPDWLVK